MSIENFDRIADLDVSITVELGKTKIAIRDLVKLNQGAIVTLQSASDEPLTFFANGKPLGLCEVVTTGDKDSPKFAIRIVELFNKPRHKI